MQSKGIKANRFNRVKEKPKNLKATLLRLWGLFGKEKIIFIGVFILITVETLIMLSVPYLIGKSIDCISTGVNNVRFNKLIILLGSLIIVYIVDSIINLCQGLIMASVAQKIVKNIRKSFFNKLQKLPTAFFDLKQNGDIMSRLTNDIDNISTTISSSITTLMSSTINITGAFVMMIVLSPMLTIAGLITAPLVMLLSKTIARKTKIYFKAQQDTLGDLNAFIEETMSGLEVIKSFNKEDDVIKEFEYLNKRYRVEGYKAQIWSGYLMPLINVINNFGFAMIALFGGILAIKEFITIGVIASFISYSKQFVRPLNDIANIFNTLQSALAGAERVFEVLDENDEVKDKQNPIELKDVIGKVEFNDVSFSYDGKKTVLKDISFSVKPGQSIAIVGATGSGKTTIVNLLTRFYEISNGNIFIDGFDIRDYSRESLRKVFGIVLQDTYLFTGTIKENISYGKEDATKEEIIEAAKVANAHTFISRLPKGYDTILTEGGGNLSAGQRQLIAIARAVLSDPAILILDEATSNVDTRTELNIQQAMLKLMSGRTSFIIAHRLSTIKDADVIMVVEDGRIVEFKEKIT